MSKHTPGPWIHDTRGYPHADVRAVCGRRVAITWGVNNQPKTPEAAKSQQEIARANARLIAAAPELLEELKKRAINARQSAFEDWLSKESPSGDGEQVHRQWEASSAHSNFVDEWGSALDVIAKATGEQA